MSHKHDLSHRQEREHHKQEHAHSTPRKFTSRHVGIGLAAGIILIGLAVLIWTIFLTPMTTPN